MSKPRVYIRADGNEKIGLGHIYRCLALGHMLKENFNIYFVCKRAPEKIIEEIEKADFLLLEIEEEKEFLAILKTHDIVVLDHYGLDSDYQQNIKQIGSKLVCIDDRHQKEFYADLIINHAPGIKPEDYRAQPYTQFALGTDYVLLRPEFIQAALKPKNENALKQNSILVCFGGSDYKNITELVLKELLPRKEFSPIIIITGSEYKYGAALKVLIDQDPARVIWKKNLSANEMLKTMENARYGVFPASGILFEAMSIRMLIVSGIYTENQRDIYEGFKKKNVFEDAGDFCPDMLRRALDSICTVDHTVQINKMRQLFDGLSPVRILNLFKAL